MKLKVLRRKKKEIGDFAKREWKNADIEHYGKPKHFKPEKFIIIALNEDNTIIGKVSVVITAGVGEIHEVIVAKSLRGTGVGNALMERLEKLARKHAAHKLFLNTGKGWRAEEFYQKLGFVKVSELSDHFAHRDFVQYTKIIM